MSRVVPAAHGVARASDSSTRRSGRRAAGWTVCALSLVASTATVSAGDAPVDPPAEQIVVGFDRFELSAEGTTRTITSDGVAVGDIVVGNLDFDDDGSSISSLSLGSLDTYGDARADAQQPDGDQISSPLADLTLGDIIAAATLPDSPLDDVPLVEVTADVEWEDTLRRAARRPDTPPDLHLQPLQEITLGDVEDVDDVSSLELRAIDVAGTPIASLPIASLALGSTPIASLPIDQITDDHVDDWCDWIGENDPSDDPLCEAGDEIAEEYPDVTLVDLSLRGLPIASLPIASLPIASLPIASLPIASLPIEGTPIASLPIASLPIASLPIASLPIASLPIASLEIAGTPIASLPIASLPIASLPIASLPIASLALEGTPIASLDIEGLTDGEVEEWCDWIGETDPSDEPLCEAGDQIEDEDPDVTLVDLSLRGLPIASLPIASLPIASLPIASLPIASLEIAGTPIASLPIASLPIASLPIASLPIASLPIASLPIASLPIASLEIDGTPIASLPIASLPIASLPIASLPIASLPIASLTVAGTPIASLPIASLPIASLPIASLPIASLDVAGTPIASLPIASLPIASLPIASLPIASLPIASLAVSGAPIASLPIASLEIAGTPIASLPIASLPIASLPIASLPIASLPIASLPIASLPIASLEVAGTPIASLEIADLDIAGTPIASLPIASLPIASLERLVDCEHPDISCDDPALTLVDVQTADALVDGTDLGDLDGALDGYRWGDLAPVLQAEGISPGALRSALDQLTGPTFAEVGDQIDGVSFDGLTLGEAEPTIGGSVLLGDLDDADTGLRWVDLVPVLAGQGISAQDLAQAVAALPTPTFGDVAAGTDGLSFDGADLGDLITVDPTLISGVTVDQLPAEVPWGELIIALVAAGMTADERDSLMSELEALRTATTFADVEDFYGLRLDELADEVLQQLSLGDILATLGDAIGDLTLGDLLLTALDPSDRPWENVQFSEVDVAALPGLIDPVPFALDFEISGGDTPRSVEVALSLPGNASVVAGSSRLSADGGPAVVIDDPMAIGSRTTWTLPSIEPGAEMLLEFAVIPSLEVGTAEVGATGRIVGFDTEQYSTALLTVEQAFEDAPVADIGPGRIYVTHTCTRPLQGGESGPCSDASNPDVDVFQVAVADGDRLVVELSDLPVDLDLVISGGRVFGTDNLVATTEGSAGVPRLEPPTEPSLGPPTDPAVDATVGTIDPVTNEQVIAVGSRRGTADELVRTPPLAAGVVSIRVVGANGADSAHPVVLQVARVPEIPRPPCQPRPTFLTGVAGTSDLPDGMNTVIVVNRERFSARYHDHQEVWDALDAFMDALDPAGTGPLSNLGIVPGVLDVGATTTIAPAYDQWEAAPCDVTAANGVVRAITDELTRLRNDPLYDIDHVMIVGGDDIVPMARLIDDTVISNEFEYRDALGVRHPITAAFWDSAFLTDEPYGDAASLEFGERHLYVTDVGLGRVIDTPDEIIAQLEQFVTSGGQLDPATGFVAGYDFLDDSSMAIADEMEIVLTDVDREYADDQDDDDWTASDLRNKLFPENEDPPVLNSVNAHFDHARALPAEGNRTSDVSDLFLVQTVDRIGTDTPDALRGRITFSMGCHSGLNVPDSGAYQARTDFAQAFSGPGGIYVGNTGYGYGDTELIAFSERLMELFNRELVALRAAPGTTTAAQALQNAKNAYLAELQVISVYDEKSLMQSTFYGVPLYRVLGVEAPAPPPPGPDVTTESEFDGTSWRFTVDTRHFLNRDDRAGSYYTAFGSTDSVITAPFQPPQPLEVIDLEHDTSGDVEARGAFVLSMQSQYTRLDPFVVLPVVDSADSRIDVAAPTGTFPPLPTAVRSVRRSDGTRDSLALATGQYGNTDGESLQRLDDQIEIEVFYASPDADDTSAPEVASMRTDTFGSTLIIDAVVTDDGGVDRVVALVTDGPGYFARPARWEAVELTPTEPGSDLWRATWDLNPRRGTAQLDDIMIYLQAKDDTGNVTTLTNRTASQLIGPDLRPPTVTIGQPELESVVPFGEPLPLEFTCTDDNLDTCEATIDGRPAESTDDLGLLPLGAHLLEVVATDLAGNTTVATLPFEVTIPRTR